MASAAAFRNAATGNKMSSAALLFDFSNVDSLGVWKDGFIVAYVTATAGVLLGVYWERDSFPDDVQEYGWDVLVKSLAIELLCGTMIFAIDGRVSHIQRDEIIALETKLAPRELSEKQQADLVAAIKRFSGQKYEISVAVGSESSAFLCVLDKNLRAAGWVRQPSQFSLKTKPCADSDEVGVNLASGIHIRRHAEASAQLIEASNVLSSTLAAYDLEVEPAIDPINIKDPTVMLIMVGAKL